MIRSIPSDGVVAFNLTSNDTKPTQNIKTGSMAFETDTQDRYYFDEESKTWFLYTGPKLDFYTKINEDTYCYFGLSTDTKPAEIGLGSIFVEVNTSKAYIMDENGWVIAESDDTPTPQVVLQDKTVSPAITEQLVQPDEIYDGLHTVTVTAVTNNIDNNIQADNIKKDVTILGVTGTYEGEQPEPDTEAIEITEAIDALPDPDELTYEDADDLDAITNRAWEYVHARIANHDKLIDCIERMNEIEIERSVQISTDTTCTFDQAPSDNRFITHGAYDNTPATIDGISYTTGLKMEGSDTRFSMVTFETGAESTLTLHVTPAKRIVVDNVGKDVNENGLVVIPHLSAGEHIIRKSTASTTLYAIKLEFN